MKRFLPLLALILLTTLLLGGCKKYADKVFSEGELSITLTDEFSESPRIAFTAAYESYDVAVLIIRESAETIQAAAGSEEVSLDAYAEMLLEVNRLSADIVKEEGLTTYTYAKEADGIDYTYFVTLHRSDEAYWMVQFVTQTSLFEEKKPTLLEYALSVRFTESA